MNTQMKSMASATVLSALASIVLGLLSATPAIAAKVGYYDLNTGQGEEYQVAPIVAAGHTPVQLFDLSSEALAGVDVLFALNPSIDGGGTVPYGAEWVAGLTNVTNAVNNGLVLCFADRQVTQAATHIPGASKISFTRNVGQASEIVTFTAASPGKVNWTGHPMRNEDPVMFGSTGALPAGLLIGTVYYVKNKTANDFEVSATPGGVSINFSDTGSGTHTARNAADKNIDIFDNTTVLTNGPGARDISNTNLDGGNFSNHGFATPASLPGGNRVILVRAKNEAVTFSYPQVNGAVVYSTVPVDFYLKGAGTNPPADDFREIYSPNLVDYCATLVERSSTLGPIDIRFCHSAKHADPAACTKIVNNQEVLTTGKSSSQALPATGCASNEPTKGTGNVRVVELDKIQISRNNLDCGTPDGTGTESLAVNPISTPTVGSFVQLHAERLNTVVRLRVVPPATSYDFIDNFTKGRKRIVVESLNDGKLLEKWAINGDERISLQLVGAVADDVFTNVAVTFWVGHTHLFGPKTIIAKAYRNGTAIPVENTREVSALPKTTFSKQEVYTAADFGNNEFDRIELRVAPGTGDFFGIGSIDANTTHPAIP